MNLKYCRKNVIAHVPEFEFRSGSPTPKFFILLTDVDELSNSVIVATFTTKLKYKNKKSVVFIPKGFFQDPSKKKFPFEDSLLDCNTCCELSSMYLQRDKCKYIIQADNSLALKIHKALAYANRVDPYVIIKLQRTLEFK